MEIWKSKTENSNRGNKKIHAFKCILYETSRNGQEMCIHHFFHKYEVQVNENIVCNINFASKHETSKHSSSVTNSNTLKHLAIRLTCIKQKVPEASHNLCYVVAFLYVTCICLGHLKLADEPLTLIHKHIERSDIADQLNFSRT